MFLHLKSAKNEQKNTFMMLSSHIFSLCLVAVSYSVGYFKMFFLVFIFIKIFIHDDKTVGDIKDELLNVVAPFLFNSKMLF